jgi:hypothetical protein
MSAMTGRTADTKTNSKGESHCFNCGSPSHWAYECPQLSREQQVQLHMTVEGQQEGDQEQVQEGHQLLNVTLAQGGALPDSRAYLDGCSTVIAFKSNKHLKNVEAVQGGIKINCNAGAITTNLRGTYLGLKVWYVPDGIANIFSMHELEQSYYITYDSWDGYYVVHTPRREVRFHKDKQGLPYINLEKSSKAAAMMLLQQGKQALSEDGNGWWANVLLIQTVQGNYKGFTKHEVAKAKGACRAQVMIGNPSKKDYKGMVNGEQQPTHKLPRQLVRRHKCMYHIWP